MKTEEQIAREKLFKKISKKTGQTIREHNLIEEGDNVLAGLSGGKDSMILLEVLADRKRSFPFSFQLTAAHIIPENIGYKVNTRYLKDFCRDLGIEFVTRKTEIDLGITNKSACFICSWHRRKALFELSKELNCNKVTLGHHRDDALQTFLINMLYHGSLSSMPYELKMFEGRIKLIRPMLNLWERDLDTYSRFRKFNAVEKSCPHEELTRRNFAAEMLEKMAGENPQIKTNMFHALSNIYPDYLPNVKKKSD